MALIQCPECGKMISDKAEFCVGGGYPVKLILQDNDDFEFNESESFIDDDTDYVVLENGEPRNMGENMAISSAKEYLETQGFSKQGLIEQLEFEGYTKEEAVYGANNCGADWNTQASRSAKSYLETQGFSKQGLIEQLEFEGYTKEEAIYGANNCRVDWKQQAIVVAKSYLESMSFSRCALIEQLEYDGFTHEEAQYGVDKIYR